MIDLFVYGTLREPQLQRRLLGAAAPRRTLDAVAPGWQASRLPGAHYPILVEAPKAHAKGLILLQLGAKAMATLTAFEGPGYHLAELTVETAGAPRRACVFLPRNQLVARAGPPFIRWSFEAWRRSHGGRGRI